MERLIFLLLLLPALCWGDWNPYIAGQTIASGDSDCMSGTYMGAWDGDYPSDTDKLCVNSGASNKDGTQSGGTLVAGSYTVTDKDQYVNWTNTANDIIDEDEGTLWAEVNLDSGNSSNIYFLEVFADDSNKMTISFIESSGVLVVARTGGGATDSVTSVGTVTKGEATKIGITWSVGRSVADLAVTTDAGSAWTDEGVDGIATMSDITNVRIGNELQSTNSGQTIIYTNFAVQSGWKTACPF